MFSCTHRLLIALALTTFLLLTGNSFAQSQGRHMEHGSHYCYQSKHGHPQLAAKTSNTNPIVTPAHAARMAQYDVHHYHLDLELSNTNVEVTGNVTVKATTVADLDTFAFELYESMAVDSILYNGNTVTVSRSGGEANAILPATVPAGQSVELTIYYQGTAPGSGATATGGGGLSTGASPTWGNQVTWSLSQPYSAYEWFPCKQELTDKIDSVFVSVTTDSSNKVGSNGLLVNTVDLGNGKRRYDWESRYPIAYYLISVAVAEYIEYNFYAYPPGTTDSVFVQNYIYNNPQTLPNFQSDIDDTKDMIEAFSELFGTYPFIEEKYGHSMAPFSGGMEHQTMTTQGFFVFTLTAHELGHQWFGDYVTCGTWNDIAMNEGFATYTEYLAIEALAPGNEDQFMQDIHDDVLAEPDGAVYVTNIIDVGRVFNYRLSYQKGAAILHTLRHETNNDSLYFATLRQYLQTHADGVATGEDLKVAFENSLSTDLDWFFEQWYYGEGHPTYNVDWNVSNGYFVVELSNTTSATGPPFYFQGSVELRLERPQGDTLVRFFQEDPVQKFQFPYSGTVTGIALDPNNGLLNEEGTIGQDPNLEPSLVSTPEHTELQAIGVFPNPTASAWEIACQACQSNSRYRYRLLDATGRRVLQGHFQTGEHFQIGEGLAAGAYVLQLTEPATGARQHFRLLKR